jgi:hypothetical protein
MVRYYANVNIFSAAAAGKAFGQSYAAIEGNGNAISNDLPALRNMAEDLTSAVDKNNERVYQLVSRR